MRFNLLFIASSQSQAYIFDMKTLGVIFLFCAFLNNVQVQGYSGKTSILNGQLFQWTHSTKIPTSGLEVSWIDSHPEYVTIEVSGPVKGYVSIGFSPSGGMSGADIILGWVGKNGTASILDMYATHNGQPELDKQKNVKLLGGVENENGTRIIFQRKWNTCDDQDFPIGDDTIRLIWAMSDKDPIIQGSAPSYHGHFLEKRGVKSIYMRVRPNQRKFPDEENTYPEDVTHYDLTMNNVAVPKTETYYHCKIVKFPKLASKHHIIAHRPIIAPESIPHVHHIAVFKCHVPEMLGIKAESVFEKYLNHPGGDCYTEESPDEWTEFCFEFRVAIGAGSEGDIFPEHLGDVIGDTDGPTYYRLEVHYENPTGKQLFDSSGVRIFYTDVLRPYEIAILFGGHRRTPFLTIPPFQKEYKIYGFCGSDCTSQGIPKEGIKIVSVLLHAHLTGRKIVLRHIRNGKELPVIAKDDKYDFNYQHFRVLREEVTVLPGDQLITECTFDTEKNHTFVYGGLSTRREMCESFITYYPKSALIDCRTQPEFYSYLNAIGVQDARGDLFDLLNLPFSSANIPDNLKDIAFMDDSLILENGRMDSITHDMFRNVTITQPPALEGQDLHKYMSSLDWQNASYSRLVEQRCKLGSYYMYCNAPGGKKIHTPLDIYQFPVYQPHKPIANLCHSSSDNILTSAATSKPNGILVSALIALKLLILIFLPQRLIN